MQTLSEVSLSLDASLRPRSAPEDGFGADVLCWSTDASLRTLGSEGAALHAIWPPAEMCQLRAFVALKLTLSGEVRKRGHFSPSLVTLCRSERKSVAATSRILPVLIFEVQVSVHVAQIVVVRLAFSELHEIIGRQRGTASAESRRNRLLMPAHKAAMR